MPISRLLLPIRNEFSLNGCDKHLQIFFISAAGPVILKGMQGPTHHNKPSSKGEPNEGQDLKGKLLDKASQLRKDLRSDGVAVAWSLTPEDMCLAALNGGSDFISYVIPPLPSFAKDSHLQLVQNLVREGRIPEDVLVASIDKDLFFFLHCANAAVLQGLAKPEQLSAVVKTGFITTNLDAYEEYLDIIQNTARVIRRNIDKYCEPLAELVAIQNYLLRDNSPPLAAVNPMTEILDVQMGMLQLKAAGLESLMIPFNPGQTLVVAGAGYNSLVELPRLRQLNSNRFILNDADPFVAALLEQHLKMEKVENVEADAGDMANVSFDTNVGACIISLTYNALESSVGKLLCNYRSQTGPGRPLISLQLRTPESGEFSSEAMQNCLNEAGYKTVMRVPIPAQIGGLIPGNAQELLRSFDGEQLIEYMRSPIIGENRATVYDVVVAST